MCPNIYWASLGRHEIQALVQDRRLTSIRMATPGRKWCSRLCLPKSIYLKCTSNVVIALDASDTTEDDDDEAGDENEHENISGVQPFECSLHTWKQLKVHFFHHTVTSMVTRDRREKLCLADWEPTSQTRRSYQWRWKSRLKRPAVVRCIVVNSHAIVSFARLRVL